MQRIPETRKRPVTAAAIEPTPDPETALTVTVTHGDLYAALITTGIAVPRRAPVPVLWGVLITTGPEGAHLTTYDYRTETRVRVGPPSTDTARVLVSHRLLLDIVRVLGRPSR